MSQGWDNVTQLGRSYISVGFRVFPEWISLLFEQLQIIYDRGAIIRPPRNMAPSLAHKLLHYLFQLFRFKIIHFLDSGEFE